MLVDAIGELEGTDVRCHRQPEGRHRRREARADVEVSRQAGRVAHHKVVSAGEEQARIHRVAGLNRAGRPFVRPQEDVDRVEALGSFDDVDREPHRVVVFADPASESLDHSWIQPLDEVASQARDPEPGLGLHTLVLETAARVHRHDVVGDIPGAVSDQEGRQRALPGTRRSQERRRAPSVHYNAGVEHLETVEHGDEREHLSDEVALPSPRRLVHRRAHDLVGIRRDEERPVVTRAEQMTGRRVGVEVGDELPVGRAQLREPFGVDAEPAGERFAAPIDADHGSAAPATIGRQTGALEADVEPEPERAASVMRPADRHRAGR